MRPTLIPAAPQAGRPAGRAARHLDPSGAAGAPAGVERRSRSRDGQPTRLRAELRLRLTLPDGAPAAQAAQIQELLAGDLSTGGVFVQCAEPPAVGEWATVEVCRPGGGVAFAARGRVAWRRQGTDRLGRPAGFGLSFERLDVRDSAAIRGILDLLQRQQALSAPTPAARELALYSLGDLTESVTELLGGDLPPELAAFVRGYEQVGDRDAFLWRWAYQGVCISTLSSVDPRLLPEVHALKLLCVMYAVLLDDAADRAAAPGASLDASASASQRFAALCQLWLTGISTPAQAQDRAFLAFAQRVHQEFTTRVEGLGRHGEFADLLHFDKQQLVSAAQHQLLVRKSPHFTSEGESRAHAPVGIPLALGATIDLCASPGFDARETGLLREILGVAQRMTHTGHLLVSWERQLETGDLTGAVVAHGLASGALGPADLDPASGPARGPRLAQRLREQRVDSHFLTDWLRDRFTLRELAARLRSVDVGQLLSAQQRLMWLQLSSRGLT